MGRNIEFDVTPMGAPRLNRSDAWKGRPVVERYHAFRDELRLKANVAQYRVADELQVTFILPMPSSWNKARQAMMDGMPHQQKPDIDNICKGFMDALCEDDAYVWCVNAKKYWGREGKIIIHIQDS